MQALFFRPNCLMFNCQSRPVNRFPARNSLTRKPGRLHCVGAGFAEVCGLPLITTLKSHPAGLPSIDTVS